MRMFVRVTAVLFFFVLHQCASYTDEIKDMRQDFMNQKYKSSLERIEKSPLKTSDRNRLLYNMEKAMILDRMEEFEGSRKHLFQADKIADDLYTTSISRTAETLIINESMSDYEGEDYEKVAIHTMAALSFLEEGKISEARVEAKKINSKLHEITQTYDPKYLHYKEDAFARFLSGIIYEKMQNWDDAIIDFRKALEVYNSSAYSKFYEGGTPEVVVTSLYGVALKRKRTDIIKDLKAQYPKLIQRYEAEAQANPHGGDIVVFHEAGYVAIKQAKEFLLPVSDQIVRLSFPYIDRQKIDWRSTQTGVKVDGSYIQAVNTLNMNALAYQCLEDRRGRLIAKGIARLLLKGQLTYQAQKNFGLLGGIAANVFSAVTETADTRSWTLLPEAFYVNRVRVNTGKHSVETKTAGRITNIRSVDVKSDDLTILRSKS